MAIRLPKPSKDPQKPTLMLASIEATGKTKQRSRSNVKIRTRAGKTRKDQKRIKDVFQMRDLGVGRDHHETCAGDWFVAFRVRAQPAESR